MSAGLESLANACSGAAAGMAAKFIVYPLDWMKLRLSVKSADESATTIVRQALKEHGVGGVYMGLGPRLVRTGGQKLNYFYAYAMLQQLYKVAFPGRALGVAANLVVGFLADVCCVVLVVPLELMSMQQSEGAGFGAVVSQTWKEKGLGGFYQGWQAYVVGGIMPAIQYTGFDQGKRIYLAYLANGSTQLSALASFVLGALSRTLADLIAYPIRVPQNVQQSSKHELRNSSFFTIVATVIRQEGVGGMFKGIAPQLAQGVLGSAIMMMFKERMDSIVRLLIFGMFGGRVA